MTIHFANEGKLDLDTIRVMGVSVKPNSDTPIGYFGTGLKYAIATLLRTDHFVRLVVGGERFDFRAVPTQIRGEMFDVVYMNDEKLSFTTDLGRNWEPWMAFRELYSNCLDEVGGVVTDQFIEADTVIAITGDGINEAYYKRHEIFLQTQPKWVTSELEIHPNPSDHVYYRGVRVLKLVQPSKFTYNFLHGVSLTEDRTASSTWDIMYRLGRLIPTVPDEKFHQRMLRKRKVSCIEDERLDFSYCGDPSDEFLEVAAKKRSDATVNPTIHRLTDQHRSEDISEMDLSSTHLAVINEAHEMLKILNCHLMPHEVKWVSHLGAGVYAMVRDGQIYVAEQTINNGADFLCITLWEEYLHRDLGHEDESRSMQQYLFDKILAFVKEKHLG